MRSLPRKGLVATNMQWSATSRLSNNSRENTKYFDNTTILPKKTPCNSQGTPTYTFFVDPHTRVISYSKFKSDSSSSLHIYVTPKKAPTDHNSISKPATCLSHRSSSAIRMLILFWEKLPGSANGTAKLHSKPVPSSFPFSMSPGQIKKKKSFIKITHNFQHASCEK